MDNDILRNAQYRKALSIAFFSATNAAIELVKTDCIRGIKDKDLKKFIVEWRNFFLKEHKNYYAENIANIGVNYDSAESIKKLKSAESLDELKIYWIELSEDERQDEAIKAEAQALKKQLS